MESDKSAFPGIASVESSCVLSCVMGSWVALSILTKLWSVNHELIRTDAFAWSVILPVALLVSDPRSRLSEFPVWSEGAGLVPLGR